MFLVTKEMATTKAKIIHNETLNMKLHHDGLRLDDEIRLKPIDGNTKKLKLSRTKYVITSKNCESDYQTSNKIVFHTHINENFALELKLFGQGKVSENEQSCRFLLGTLDGNPFLLNNQLVYKAFVERGDILQIGQNLIEFFVTEKCDLNLKNYEILKNAKLLRSQLPILISGETGTGKTYLAKKIHDNSQRRGEFVHINLSAYSPSLIESELFGHEKGAFTGAIHQKLGAFSRAQWGTLFLDEIDSLSWDMQTKLLLFLDNQKYRPVGSSIEMKIETRLIFASGRNLKGLVESGEMRRDFYYRLNKGENLRLSPLREMPSQIAEFIQYFSMENKIQFSQKLIDFYMSLPWPGNYRELSSHLEKKMILSSNSKIDFDENDESLISSSTTLESLDAHKSFKKLEDIKKDYCLKVYLSCNRNITSAAHVLSINTKTLKRMLGNSNAKM